MSLAPNDDGTVAITFEEPIPIDSLMLLGFLSDGVGCYYRRKGRGILLTQIKCRPELWKQYLREMGIGRSSPAEIESARKRFDEALIRLEDGKRNGKKQED